MRPDQLENIGPLARKTSDSTVIEIEGTIVGVGASLNSASGIGFEIEDSLGNMFTIAGLDRTDAKRVAPYMGRAVRLSVFTKDAD